MMRVARLFDGIDSKGVPQYTNRRVIADDEERLRIARFLRGGVVLLAASRVGDLIDRTRTDAVPTAYLTDGVWIWTEAAAHYVISYGIAPEEDFLEHIRANDYHAATPGQSVRDAASTQLGQHFNRS